MEPLLDLKHQLASLVDVLVPLGIPLGQARDAFERQYILAALMHHDGNLGRAADALGIHRNTLRNKVRHLGLGDDIQALRRQLE
ncbi:MAG: helix-turn-helix domain-containing protein [Acidobacteriota bacterium]